MIEKILAWHYCINVFHFIGAILGFAVGGAVNYRLGFRDGKEAQRKILKEYIFKGGKYEV